MSTPVARKLKVRAPALAGGPAPRPTPSEELRLEAVRVRRAVLEHRVKTLLAAGKIELGASYYEEARRNSVVYVEEQLRKMARQPPGTLEWSLVSDTLRDLNVPIPRFQQLLQELDRYEREQRRLSRGY